MKRILCILMLLCIALSAQAETLPELTLVTPTPSPMPTATEFACEAFIVCLPAGLELMDPVSMAAYEAAVEGLYPGNGHIQLAAVNRQSGAVLAFILLESSQVPIDAARDAALHISGSAANASETIFGANSGAGFRHSFEDADYSFHFFTNGSSLLLIASTGIDAAQLDSMFSTLDF